MGNIQHSVIDESGGLGNDNVTQLSKQLSKVFSRSNMAVMNRTITADTTLSYEDSHVIVDTTAGSVTITLAYANSWGTNKTPYITLTKIGLSNTATIQANGSDSINLHYNGSILVGGSVLLQGSMFLVSDGVSNWYIIGGTGVSCESGTYTPTITNGANVATSTARPAQFLRVGNVATVSGSVNIDPTAASTNTVFAISFPIPSNLASAFQCSGSVVHTVASANSDVGQISGDTANDRATTSYYPASALGQEVYFHFTYLII